MFEQYVSEETILKEIMYYIDTDFYNYAVMIDGAWGSGKTFLYENYLCDAKLNLTRREYCMYLCMAFQISRS